MDYQRMEKPQGGGFSPAKLRNMLLGIEKKEKEEIESKFTLRSELNEIDDRGLSTSVDCKDVDIVSELPRCSDSLPGVESPASAFEFQKAEKTQQRVPFSSLCKPAPSKWDDAHKWIASPPSNKTKTGQHQGQAVTSRKAGFLGYGEEQTKKIDPNQQVGLSGNDLSISLVSVVSLMTPPSTVRSVSMRDTGTEMTPIASQEPSRTVTPVRATTSIQSPSSSTPLTPARDQQITSPGAQLGKMNITAWARKEGEDKEPSTSVKTFAVDQVDKSVIETRAAAWVEAEKAKYLARYKREEVKIGAWENHQKAKIEAEMRKNEAEMERMRAQAHDKVMKKLAATRHKADEKLAVAEAQRNRLDVKTEKQAEYIRRTGRIPSSFSWWSCCP